MAFVPDFVLTTIDAPGAQPYSAAYGLVITLNSEIASTDGREICVVNSWTLVEKLLLATPSRRKLFWRLRLPWTLTPPVRPAEVPPACSVYRSLCTPGTIAIRSSQFRIASGSFCISSLLTTVPSAADSVLSSGVTPATVTISPMVPTGSEMSSRERAPIASEIVCSNRWKPVISACTRYSPGSRFKTR